MSEMRLVVAGAPGRMGRALIRVVAESKEVRLAAALAREGDPHIGRDAGEIAGCGALGVAVTSDPLAAIVRADGVLDFTSPKGTLELAALAAQGRVVHVIGTTGFCEDDLKRLSAAARHAVIVRSGNMSLGVNLMAALVETAARALGPEFDIEIVEMHHRLKVDAPSGTALLLGEAAAKGRAVDLAEKAVRARDGHTGPRPDGAIGFATLRGGTVVGEHGVIFAGAGERLSLSHVAEDRAIFARGALKAALWGRGRAAGGYTMRDVLGLGG